MVYVRAGPWRNGDRKKKAVRRDVCVTRVYRRYVSASTDVVPFDGFTPSCYVAVCQLAAVIIIIILYLHRCRIAHTSRRLTRESFAALLPVVCVYV